jgi:hypothetical protein
MKKSQSGYPPAWRNILVAYGLGASFVVVACATNAPPPRLAIESAERAIATADKAGVVDASSPSLAEARLRLGTARHQSDEQHMDRAERLADESRIDAELASATFDAAKNQAVNDEIARSNAVLVQEIERRQGAMQ